MLFFGHHGARPEEQVLGQHFQVDLEMAADLTASRASDRLLDTIDYGNVYATVKQVVEGPAYNLLERLADEIASRVLAEHRPLSVRVRVAKPRLPIRGGVLRAVSVEVFKQAP